MKIGDKVEYCNETRESTGVIGVITGFYDGRARVLCPSGHEWLLRIESIKKLPIEIKPVSPLGAQ